MPIRFNRNFSFHYEKPEDVEPGIRRVVARNPKDYTWVGTNTYVVGRRRVAILDPGPDTAEHVSAVLAAVDGRDVIGIFLTHSHRDHAPAARPLARATRAPVFGFGAIDPALAALTEEDVDVETVPDIRLEDGAVLEVDQGIVLTAVHTPGHFPNHLCYAVTIHNGKEASHDGQEASRRLLFTGDHVMGWSTTVIVPPLGNLEHYLDSLVRLLAQPARHYLPSHGPAIADGPRYVRALLAHRHMRERQIVSCLARGIHRPEAIVAAIYEGLTPRLERAAAGSVRAHLAYLEMRGMIDAEGRLTCTPAEIDTSWPHTAIEAVMEEG
ncbi:MAG: MBL fold metallo-hydrolase [Alphaproteobacteria bacterium]|nr:MAG: MBL fold metallo-hydrolase [Alphaproteobacteria bacterium]